MTKKPSKNGASGGSVTDAQQDAPKTPDRRGNEDRVHRLRSQVWFCLVQARKTTPEHPGEMDEFFLGDRSLGGRVFQRIRDNASDPGLPRSALENDSVVGRVASRSGYRDTQEVYDSALWTVLGPTPLEPEERELLIESLLRKFGLYESPSEDAFIFRTLGLSDFEGLARTRADFRRGLSQHSRKRSIDRILLLCLLYRRYFEGGRAGEARDARNAVIRAIHLFCNRPGFHGAVKTLWLFITRRRVFTGQLSLEHTQLALHEARLFLAGWKARCQTETALARLESQVWHYACIRENAEEAPAPHMIRRTLAVEQFLSGRDQLMAKALETAVQAHMEAMPDFDGPVSAATRFAEMRGYRE